MNDPQRLHTLLADIADEATSVDLWPRVDRRVRRRRRRRIAVLAVSALTAMAGGAVAVAAPLGGSAGNSQAIVPATASPSAVSNAVQIDTSAGQLRLTAVPQGLRLHEGYPKRSTGPESGITVTTVVMSTDPRAPQSRNDLLCSIPGPVFAVDVGVGPKRPLSWWVQTYPGASWATVNGQPAVKYEPEGPSSCGQQTSILWDVQPNVRVTVTGQNGVGPADLSRVAAHSSWRSAGH